MIFRALQTSLLSFLHPAQPPHMLQHTCFCSKDDPPAEAEALRDMQATVQFSMRALCFLQARTRWPEWGLIREFVLAILASPAAAHPMG